MTTVGQFLSDSLGGPRLMLVVWQKFVPFLNMETCLDGIKES